MILALLACVTVPCGEGFVARDDGVCVPARAAEGATTVEDVIAGLPACVLGAPGDTLDIDAGCADGACVGMTAEAISDALGEPPTCAPFTEPQYQATYVDCAWARGIGATFEDDDADGVPDEYATAWSLGLTPPYAGATADGLGLDAGFACFVDALGEPDSAWLTPEDDGWRLSSLAWENLSVGWDPEDGAWDATPSWLRLY